MRRSGLLWGACLVLVGIVLLLDQLGIFPFGVSLLLLPALLILLGAWIVWGATRPAPTAAEQLSLPLEAPGTVRVVFQHGAGRLRIHADAPPGTLLEGSFDGGVHSQLDRSGDLPIVRLSHAHAGYPVTSPWPWWRDRAPTWDIRLSREVPIEVVVRTWGAEAKIDLPSLKLARLDLAATAASCEVTLPLPSGHIPISLRLVAGSALLGLPYQTQARIRGRGSLSENRIDRQRFPAQDEGQASAGYATASDRYDIETQVDLGSLAVR